MWGLCGRAGRGEKVGGGGSHQFHRRTVFNNKQMALTVIAFVYKTSLEPT